MATTVEGSDNGLTELEEVGEAHKIATTYTAIWDRALRERQATEKQQP